MPNPGLPFDRSYFDNISIHASSVNILSQKIINDVSSGDFFTEPSKSSGRVKLDWLAKSIEFMDLTTLAGDDTESNVVRLSYSASQPVPVSIGKSMTNIAPPVKCAAVCVYPSCVSYVARSLNRIDDLGVRPNIAAVATGFPTGQYGLESRLEEIKFATAAGANEIDIVIQRGLVLTGNWESLYEEIKKCKLTCAAGGAKMKTILSTGELGSLNNIYKASMVAMLAGSDFIKTSTGKESVNATIPVGIVMCRAIYDYYRLSNGVFVGLKPAGGLKTFKHACQWMHLVQTHLSCDWLTKDLFRLGASSLLDDVVNELSKEVLKRPLKAEDYLED